MSIWSDWFLAEESEAEAIADVVRTEERGFDDWPHLAMKLGDLELMLLRGVMAGSPGELPDIHGDDLAGGMDEDGGGVSVFRILPAFVDELAALKEAGILEAASRWIGCEGMEDWTEEEAAAQVTEIAEFARRAGAAGTPVLSLATW
ncbi:MAG: hypothetical protein K2W96_01560 [Gemmataceae bacterium]|nr:hypothetical protein [Gemmataceae bacterium]